MYATIVHNTKKALWKPNRWDVQVNTFASLPDAVAAVDRELMGNIPAGRSIQTRDVSAEDKESGIPSVMMETHEHGKDVWLIWAPQTAPSKIIFQNTDGVITLKGRFSVRTLRNPKERGSIVKNDVLCEICF